jgi:hypothetical protein
MNPGGGRHDCGVLPLLEAYDSLLQSVDQLPLLVPMPNTDSPRRHLRLHQPERVAAWCAKTAGRECLAIIGRNQRQVPTDDAYLNGEPRRGPSRPTRDQHDTSRGDGRAAGCLLDPARTLPASPVPAVRRSTAQLPGDRRGHRHGGEELPRPPPEAGCWNTCARR